jgi:ribosome biogenesis GTPase A
VSVALFAAEHLMDRYAEALVTRYKLAELPESASTLIEQIGRKRGCLIAGGKVDQQRASELFLRELRAGLIGLVSLEMPEDVVER